MLKQPAIQKILYTEKKPGDSRKRPIRAGELEKLEIPYFTMERQRDFAACWEKLAEIQELEERMARLGRTLFEEMRGGCWLEKSLRYAHLPRSLENLR